MSSFLIMRPPLATCNLCRVLFVASAVFLRGVVSSTGRWNSVWGTIKKALFGHSNSGLTSSSSLLLCGYFLSIYNFFLSLLEVCVFCSFNGGVVLLECPWLIWEDRSAFYCAYIRFWDKSVFSSVIWLRSCVGLGLILGVLCVFDVLSKLG